MKVESVSDILISIGRVFDKVAAATADVLSAALTCVRRTFNMLSLAERTVLAGVYGHTRSDRYFGVSPCTSLYVNTNSLSQFYVLLAAS